MTQPPAKLARECRGCGEPWLWPTAVSERYLCVCCLQRYELVSVCPTAARTPRSCGGGVPRSLPATAACNRCLQPLPAQHVQGPSSGARAATGHAILEGAPDAPARIAGRAFDPVRRLLAPGLAGRGGARGPRRVIHVDVLGPAARRVRRSTRPRRRTRSRRSRRRLSTSRSAGASTPAGGRNGSCSPRWASSSG
jgi:hypothetical protein